MSKKRTLDNEKKLANLDDTGSILDEKIKFVELVMQPPFKGAFIHHTRKKLIDYTFKK